MSRTKRARGAICGSAFDRAAIHRDAGAHARLAEEVLSELAVAPDRARTGDEWSSVARALMFHGLWKAADSIVDDATALDALERARIAWLAGRGEAAAALFRQARDEGLASDAYLTLCEQAAGAP